MPSFLKNIHMVSRAATQFLEERMQERGQGVKGCHTKYLFAVCNNPGISQDKLAKTVFVNKSNVARQLAALEEGGYIERRECESDARSLLVYPTKKAAELLPVMREANAEWREAITYGFSEEEKAQLLILTERLYENAAQYMSEKR